jgi:tripartite-type tricarboxylate transporter receptor subunit TctC
MLRAQTSAPFTHVPYKGAAPAVVDLIAGRVDCFFVSYSSIHKQVEQGVLRVLAVAGETRLAALPQTPTLREVGYDKVLLDNWFALVAPARTAQPDVQRIHRMFADVLARPDMVRQMAEQGVQAASSTPSELASLMRSDTERLGRIVREVGASAD